MVQKVPAKVAAKAAGKRKQAEEAAAQGFDDAERAILPGAEAQDAQRRFGPPRNPHDPPEAHALGAAADGAAPSGDAGASAGELAGGSRPAHPEPGAAHLSPGAAPESSSPPAAKKAKGKEAKGGSRFKGVYVDKAVASKWKASIRLEHKEVHLGYYENEEDAARAYDKASICAKGYPKNLPLNAYDETELAAVRAHAGDVEKLRAAMGIGRPAKNARRGNAHRGVCLEKKTGKWRAEIQINGRKESLGYHADERDAVAAYDRAAIVVRGASGARTNRPAEEYEGEMASLLAFNGSFEAYQATLQTKARRSNQYSSPFRGVRRHEHAQKRGAVSVKWRAEITVDGKKKALGYHASEKEAAAAYDAFAVTLPGFNRAWLNFPNGSGEQDADAQGGAAAGAAAGAAGAAGDAPRDGVRALDAAAAAAAEAPSLRAGGGGVREKSLGGTKGKKAAAAAAAAAAEGRYASPPGASAPPERGYLASLEDE